MTTLTLILLIGLGLVIVFVPVRKIIKEIKESEN